MVDNVLEFQMNSSVNDISLIHSSTVYGMLRSSLFCWVQSTAMGGADGETIPNAYFTSLQRGKNSECQPGSQTHPAPPPFLKVHWSIKENFS